MLHGAGILTVVVLLVVAFAAASGRGESAMVARLGNALYWAACVVAGLLALIAAYAILFGTGEDRVFIDAALAIIAVVIWLVGRACRYVLAGR